MRVLFLAGACPYPPNSGGTMRTYNLLIRLCHRHEITLVAPSAREVDLAKAFGGRLERVIAVEAPSRSMSRSLVSLLSPLPYIVKAHENPAMAQAVRQALCSGSFDLLHCDSISAIQAVQTDSTLPMVFNAHNVEAVIWERYVREERRPWMQLILRSQLKKVVSYEQSRLPIFDWCVAVSEEDRAEIQRRYGIKNSGVTANGVDLDYYQLSPDSGALNAVFVGSLDWRPNQDAARWFLDSIWPLIGDELPEATFTLVGRRPPKWIRRLCARARVSLRADVLDVRDYLAKAGIVVVPLRIGGGSRLKILEAMAAGRCVISTTVGAEGLQVRDGEHLVIADDPAVFANRAISLLRDSARRQRIAQAGRALVESRYGWDSIVPRMEDAWNRALHSPNAYSSRGNPYDTHTAARIQ